MDSNQQSKARIWVESYSASDVGQTRKNNEDFVTFYEPNDEKVIASSGCLYIVADGVGGASKGERASSYAAQKVLYEYYQKPELAPADRLRTLLRQVGNEIYDFAIENAQPRMATTMVAAAVFQTHMVIANVGDSRAYLIREGTVTQLTQDHNQVAELIRNGEMTEEEGLHSRVKNVITRSLGGHQDVTVDIFEYEIEAGDLIILCSDGLTRYAKTADILQRAASGKPEEIANSLIEFANQSGGADNVSVIAVSIRNAVPSGATGKPAGQMKPPNKLDTQDTWTGTRLPRVRRHRRQFTMQHVLWAMGSVLIITLCVTTIIMYNQLSNKSNEEQASTQTTNATRTQTINQTTNSTLTTAIYNPNPLTINQTHTPEPSPTGTQTLIPTPTIVGSPLPSPQPIILYKVEDGDILSYLVEDFNGLLDCKVNQNPVTCDVKIEEIFSGCTVKQNQKKVEECVNRSTIQILNDNPDIKPDNFLIINIDKTFSEIQAKCEQKDDKFGDICNNIFWTEDSK